MTLPIRRHHRPLAERRGVWARDPLSEFDDLFDRMGTLLESTVGGLAPAVERWAPNADFYETDDAYLIEADLPGIRREDVDVEIAERELTITGEMKEEVREGHTLRRGTRRTGRFEYRTTLPSQVKEDEVSASLTNGVLTVRVPKAPDTKARHVEITSGD